jgi:hypothetical protein
MESPVQIKLISSHPSIICENMLGWTTYMIPGTMRFVLQTFSERFKLQIGTVMFRFIGTTKTTMFPPPELPDGDLNPRFGGPQLLGSVIGFEKSNGEEIEPEAVEAYIDVSDDVDWAVGIDVHRFMALLSLVSVDF